MSGPDYAADARAEILDLQFEILRVSNYFLKQVSNFTVQELEEHDDPTYEQVAIDARALSSMIESFSKTGIWSEEKLVSNAKQAALIMERMASAIVEKDHDRLKTAAEELRTTHFY